MLVLLIAYLAFVSLGLPDAIIGVAWPSVRDTFALSQSDLGAILAGTGGGYFVTGLVAGRLMNAFGIGTVLVGSTALVAAGLAGFAAAPAWPLPIAAAFVVGLGSGAIDAGVIVYASANFSARRVNWLHACYSLGAATGPLIMTAAVTRGWGWRTGYGVIAAALTLMALVFLATRPLWRAPAGGPGVAGGAHPDGAGGEDSRAWAALRHPLVVPQIVLFFCYTGLEITLGQWAFTVNTEARGVAVDTAGLWTGAYWGSILLGRILLGAVVGRLGPDRLVRACTFGALLGAALFAAGPPLLGLCGLVVAGFSLAPIFPTLISRTSGRLPPAVALHAVGFKVSAAMLGSAAVPYLAGAMAERRACRWSAGWPLPRPWRWSCCTRRCCFEDTARRSASRWLSARANPTLASTQGTAFSASIAGQGGSPFASVRRRAAMAHSARCSPARKTHGRSSIASATTAPSASSRSSAAWMVAAGISSNFSARGSSSSSGRPQWPSSIASARA
jgi:fucose permease